jgi:hypothetical protein
MAARDSLSRDGIGTRTAAPQSSQMKVIANVLGRILVLNAAPAVEGLHDRPAGWFDCRKSHLRAASWAHRPWNRSVQVIQKCFGHSGLPSAVQPGQQRVCTTWLSTGGVSMDQTSKPLKYLSGAMVLE